MPSAIRIENVSKNYLIAHGRQHGPYRTLRETVCDFASAPLRRLRGLQNGQVERFWALKDVNLAIEPGEVVGIIGGNGAGKSTLLKVLSRITAPTTGRVELCGRVGSLLEVGTGFHPEMTGRENVYLNGSILGMSRREIQAKFDEIVAFSGVEKFLDTPVKRYSSGMYVRLAFAVAAHLEPEILIVDEVLAVGDAEFQRKCLGKMKQVAGGGRTILFVSHNMSAVRSLCQKAALLNGGRITQTGPVNTVVDRYLDHLNSEANLEVDLSAVPRMGSSGCRLRIQQLRINGGRGIWHGQPLEVEFDFECLGDAEDVSFGIGFCSRDGSRVLTIDSDIPGRRWNFQRGQRGIVRLVLPVLLLEPDFYTVDIGSRSGDNAALEYLPQSGQVTVVPGETTPPVIAMRESGRGGVRMPAQWELDLD